MLVNKCRQPDFKQLPPATSKAPFIRLPAVRNEFDFRVLRQNRRVVKDDDDSSRKIELENFHKVLLDVSMGIASDRVKQFIIQSYVKGMISCGTAKNSDLEGNTAVFTKRRYRDRWNRTIVRRISAVANHTLKVKARLRARGSRGNNWYSDSRTEYIRKKARTQSLFNLCLSGDFHESLETEKPNAKPHLMRP